MAETNPKCYHISASSIAAFKACPQRFRLAYREGLRVIEDTESQRYGNAWHGMHEAYANAAQDKQWVGTLEDHQLGAAVAYLDQRYATIPNHKTAFEWGLERQILLTSFLGYLWFWQHDPIEFLASELAFNLPLHLPTSGLPLLMSEVQRVGKIDHVIKWQGKVGALERKSTSRAIDDASDYWDKAKKDTQVSMYALAFREMFRDMPENIRIGAAFTGPAGYGNTLYDVWHRPTIKPKVLTQAETAQFIADGKYMGSEFKVEAYETPVDGDRGSQQWVSVDGVQAEIEMGKKGFAIKETIEMYAARLMQDIYARPEFYYRRREIARTDQDLTHFRKQLFSIYQSQKLASKYGAWVENEHQCRATFPCPFIPICYGPGADAVCDGKTTPNGFKRIFVDLTVKGEALDE